MTRPHGVQPVTKFVLSAVAIAALASTTLSAQAALDVTGPPPATDPSHYTNQPTDPTQALQDLLLETPANEGGMELPNGEVMENKRIVNIENVIQRDALYPYNYPTNGLPSPMFGAQPFTQKLLMFEEFGPEKLDPNVEAGTLPFPRPAAGVAPEQEADITRSGPAGADLDAFLQQAGISPFPTRESNTSLQNPWKPDIEQFLGRFLTNPPAEGRPPGEGWAHQRWNEFYPQAYYKTVQAGSRVNGGLRDSKQMHKYQVGEFGPGGLYYNTVDNNNPAFNGTTRGIPIKIHPNMPTQDHKNIWTFDGTLPPKLLMARYGQPMLMRHYNALPIDPQANGGFGLHTITTHEHNGHSPAESDGFANAFFFPGQFYDYRWPLQLAGYDSINTTATEPRAGFPCAAGETLWVNDANPGVKTCQNGRINIRGDWRETMSTHWFHDHMLDFTAQNVYKGNAVMMNYYSALDRGNEAINDGVNLRFPSGQNMAWGNRDYDVNLVIGDKAWDQTGQLWFNPFNTDGFIGDRLTVNWQYAPVLDVRARKYRFRILNGSVSRYLSLAIVAEATGNSGELKGPAGSGKTYKRVPFHLVANDGNILEHAIPFDGTMDLDGNGNKDEHKGWLPTQAIAERFDIVVDFANFATGTKLYFINTMHHDTGIIAKRKIPLADILSEKYKAVLTPGKESWDKGDPAVGMFMQMVVKAYSGTDMSMNPAEYEPAKPGKAAGKKMIPLWLDRSNPTQMAALQNARYRTFDFGRSSGTDLDPWTVKTDGGVSYIADPRRISAAPQLASGPTDAGTVGDGTTEVWRITSGGGWSHPVHIHFEEGIILDRNGNPPPEWEKWSRKDVYRVGGDPESGGSLTVALRFREFAGTYVEHCHNTQHEDNAMLLRWDIEHPGQFQVMPTPLPTWDGVEYAPSVGIPTFRTGSGTVANH
ncbi:multicopper oxidase domain-containing protein [Ramlibacter alkalitolerans]|uniref:Multicopper oxidase domain-containing protein n=1 Tax=Ramlibacter alkalitolerans TaxID=2039631 RepID=A0ABS1JW90_9BURK|nr:multicopper oxidase domain-containing protein [Ramlibacter alkalitolerans]MBL0428538.1 multicopper oxidase domain-containing protein [Ramlibacter alkalitolerans]